MSLSISVRASCQQPGAYRSSPEPKLVTNRGNASEVVNEYLQSRNRWVNRMYHVMVSDAVYGYPQYQANHNHNSIICYDA
uniref:SFRICE_036947 n=1 Tax=Spodoptera frugiperda TaxID=7108 RepID=A0A2H1W661_SPOFR